MDTTSSSPSDLPSIAGSARPGPGSPQPRTDATGRLPAAGGRALVLGGGGSTGHAWLVGVLAGLVAGGLDVTSPDLTVGTSAGATVAAQLGSVSPAELYAGALTPVPAAQAGAARGHPGGSVARRVSAQVQRVSDTAAGARDVADMRRRVGAAALRWAAESDGSWQAQWRATVAARLGDARWPTRTVLLTAVDAETGEPVVFDRDSGVDLVDAVAASCSSRLPYRIGDRHYIDGGYRANAENADLAAGHRRVLVLAPFGGRALTPVEWGTHLNAMDLSLRPAAARTGYAQGGALAQHLAGFWR